MENVLNCHKQKNRIILVNERRIVDWQIYQYVLFIDEHHVSVWQQLIRILMNINLSSVVLGRGSEGEMNFWSSTEFSLNDFENILCVYIIFSYRTFKDICVIIVFLILFRKFIRILCQLPVSSSRNFESVKFVPHI